jgi:hypothetical protein
MSLCRPRRKKKPSHITQVSTTFMLFHVDLLSALGGKQRLIFINKALRALDGRIAVKGVVLVLLRRYGHLDHMSLQETQQVKWRSVSASTAQLKPT